METKNLDIIYFVKDGHFDNKELRLSLRSVDANMPHRRVWIFGGCPVNVVPDVRVRVDQIGKTKWDKVRAMFRMACENKEITDNFILFNDDFYVMKPTSKIETLYRCTLDKHIEILKNSCNGKMNEYTRLLKNARDMLGENSLSYELHTPFIFNKKKLLNILDKYPDMHCMRTMYGNLYKIGGTQSSDVKMFTYNPGFDYKKTRFLSTDDGMVNINNDAWRYLRAQFPRKSRFEIN